jgi:filamentous hemagglutinin family protein
MNINTPDRTVLTWGAFGIDATDTINFDIPTPTSSILNIVNGGASTTINGAITSIGNVYILNKNGITVNTATASIAVANLGLSTADEAPFNFQNSGTLSYPNTATQPVSITGTGTITATNNGTVTIVGKGVNLTGNIIAGALNVNSQAGNVVLGDSVSNNVFALGNSTTKAGNLTVTTGGGNIDLANGTGAVTIWGGTANLTTGNGNIGQTSTGAFKVGTAATTTSTGTLIINAGTGTVTATTGKIDGNTSPISVTVTAAGATSLATDAGDITLNASTIAGNLSLTSAGKITATGVAVTGAASTISLSSPVGNSGNISYSGTGNLTFAKIQATTAAPFTNSISLTTTAGAIVLPTATDSSTAATTYGSLSVKATGNITNAAAAPINATGTVTFDAGDTLAISTSSAIPTLVLKNAPNGASLTSTSTTLTLAKGSAATGNVTLSAPSFAFGTASGDSQSYTNLSLTATAAGPANTITDASDTVTVSGALTLTPGVGNSLQLDGKLGTGVGFAGNYGQINIVNGANATVFGKTSLNLGTIALTGNLLAIATAGNITDSGQLKIGGWVTVGAGTAAAPGNINLDFTAAAGSGNQITGTIYLQDDINLLLGTTVAGGATTIGNYMANNVTVMNENAITVSPITNTYAAGIGGNLTLTGNGITLGNTIIGGTAALTSIGAITATGTNTIPAFTINATKTTAGAVVIAAKSSGSTTINATLSGPASNGSSATFTSGGNITLGTVTSNYDGAGGVVFDATAAGTITDTAVGGLQIYGPTTFTANTTVSVTKGGDNFGTLTLDSKSDGATISLVESGTSKLASVNNSGKKVSVNLTSQNGSIIEATNAVIKGGSDTTKALSLSAVNGNILLDQATNHTFAGPLNITVNGTGNATYNSAVDTALGNVTVSGGTLSVDVSSIANKKLVQASGSSAYVYGNLTLKAAGTGDITLANNGNRFGAYAIANATGNISVTEDTTINLQAIATSGNLTIKSNNGFIIDSTNASLPAGYTNSIVVGGTSTFTANAAGGSIALALPNSSYSVVGLNTTGNASVISNAGAADLTLGSSVVGGSLSVTNNSANRAITQNAPLAITGTTSFTTAGALGASINLSNANNQFGGIRFYGSGTGGVSINEATTLNLLGGSLSNGNVFLSTGGNFITTGPGGSSISGNLNISANGTIIPTAGSLLVTGTFTVYSIGTTDLSALSKSGNLFNKAPVNTGPGTYIPPSL